MEEAAVIRATEQQATGSARILWIVLNHCAGFHHAADFRRQNHAFGTRHLAQRVRQEENLQRRRPADFSENDWFSGHGSDCEKQIRPLRRAHLGNHGSRRPRAARENRERKKVEQSRAEFHAAE